MDISDWRKKIDELDDQIVRLISQRAAAAQAIGELKKYGRIFRSMSRGGSRMSSTTFARRIPGRWTMPSCCMCTSGSST